MLFGWEEYSCFINCAAAQLSDSAKKNKIWVIYMQTKQPER